VFISIKRRKTAAAARSFLKEVAKAAPFVISTILTPRFDTSPPSFPAQAHLFDGLTSTWRGRRASCRRSL
jgi:hypothetical protein